MAGITTAVVVGAAAAYSANEKKKSASRASARQSRGVERAQTESRASSDRARAALGAEPVYQEGLTQEQVDAQQRRQQAQSSERTWSPSQRGNQRGTDRGGMSSYLPQATPEPSQDAPKQQFMQQQPIKEAAAQQAQPQPQSLAVDPRQELLSGIEGQMMYASQGIGADTPAPRNELLAGLAGEMSFTGQGYGRAQETISPLAAMAQPYLDEQYNLLGLGGDEARQAALSRVSDPLAAEQERAMLRNNAQLGGVGGNVLSALAEQTRARTEANIGNRLGQLSNASSPALSALQNLSNLRLNEGLGMAGIMGRGGSALSAQETARRSDLSNIMGQGGFNLAQQESARRQALANLELGQGSELAQLAQNLGTAQAGRHVYNAQNDSPWVQGLQAGVNAYTGGAAGMMGGGGGNQTGTLGQQFQNNPYARN